MKLNKNPEFKTKQENMCNIIYEIDNTFLQALADAGAYVMLTGRDFWVLTGIGQLWLKIHDEAIHLECIAVNVDDRRQGNGSKLMDILVQCSDESGIPITLQVDNVSRGKGYSGASHPAVGCGQHKKNKIPVAALPKWYQKFGFQKTAEYTAKSKNMSYTPKTK